MTRYHLAQADGHALFLVDGPTPPQDQIVLERDGRVVAVLAYRSDFPSFGVSTMAVRVPRGRTTAILQGRLHVDSEVADRRLREAIAQRRGGCPG